MRAKVFISTLFLLLTSLGMAQDKGSADQEREAIFPLGQKGPSDLFTGNAYNQMLVEMDSVFTMLSGSVTFEAGARSNWHSHPAGQILMVISGTGYHQIKGQPKETITKGDVVKCPPNKVHWHGATENTAMTHIFIIPNTEKGIVEWKEAVTDMEFSNK